MQKPLDRLRQLLYLCNIWPLAGAVATFLGRLMIQQSNGFFYSRIGSVTEWIRLRLMLDNRWTDHPSHTGVVLEVKYYFEKKLLFGFPLANSLQKRINKNLKVKPNDEIL